MFGSPGFKVIPTDIDNELDEIVNFRETKRAAGMSGKV
jgi:hypothetical protein